MTPSRIFISGATGFIGRQLALVLAQKGHQVHALCRDTNHPYLPRHENITAFAGDIMDVASLRTAMNSCDQVYHTAAMAKMWCKDRNDFYQVNVVGTQHVLTVAQELNVKRVVYTSTCGVLGPTIKHPMNENSPRVAGFPIDYERTKYLADLEVKKFVGDGLDVVTVNPSRVFGEGPITDSNTVSKMVTGYLKGTWRVIPGTGDNIANYAFLDDVVAGHIAAMAYGQTGHRYILGGEDISFNDFFETLRRVSGTDTRMFRIPQRVIEIYSRIDRIKSLVTGLQPVLLPEFADRLKFDQKYSSNKAIEHLGYQITPFNTALWKTVSYLQKHVQ